MAQNPADLGKRGSENPVLLNLSPDPYQTVWKHGTQLLEHAEEHGFETRWAFADLHEVRVILAVPKSR